MKLRSLPRHCGFTSLSSERGGWQTTAESLAMLTGRATARCVWGAPVASEVVEPRPGSPLITFAGQPATEVALRTRCSVDRLEAPSVPLLFRA